ncbi:MAG: erythromycin esterase family protein [Chitinophagaceae bacterium]|nr:MAG: erythromycin esterase family protein [Chitinophagaceae bacterium]
MKSVGKLILLVSLFSLLLSNCRKDNFPQSSNVNIRSHPLQTSSDLDLLLQQIGNARIVMLGEASHGTHEFYEWRAAITKRLMQEKGFDMMAVEGEWADSYRVNQFVKGGPKDSLQAVSLLRQYDRWPTWMWGNQEIASLITWMNNYNQTQGAANKVGFYGMDVYCLWESVSELMPFIQGNDSLMRIANDVAQCFRPFNASGEDYARAVLNSSVTCKTQTNRLWTSVLAYTGGTTAKTEPAFVAQQNALVAANAEKYYSSMVVSNASSWNIRDEHMAQTIQRLLEFAGPDSKIIIWAHNTHVGDARYTDMATYGEVNVGQLMRERYGQENVYLVGFGTYTGTVIASNEWGGPIQTLNVPAAQRGSWEYLLHQNGGNNQLIFSNEIREDASLSKSLGNRAIGVVYDPGNERGNYVPTVIPNRYDAFLFIDKTIALRPLHTTARNEPPDTYPWGQ